MKDSLFAISEMIDDYKYISKNMIEEEPSMAQRLERHLKKLFVLSCASYYETHHRGKNFSDVEQIHKNAIHFVNYLLSKFSI